MKEWAYRKPIRASGEFSITLLDTELDLILLDKGRFLAIPGPNCDAIQKAFCSSGKICACGTQEGKRHSPLNFISLITSRGIDQSR